MGHGLVRFIGKIDKVLEKKEKKGPTRVLLKNQPQSKKLKDSIVMLEFKKCQWKALKKIENFMDQTFHIDAEFQAMINKDNKPFLYARCTKFKLIQKGEQATDKEPVKIIRWFEQISEEEFQDIDISKVKIVEDIHLRGMVERYNIEKLVKIENLTPIAVRKVGEEYELVAGLASYIAAKVLSKDIKAYVTDLDVTTFREKFSIF